MADARYYAVNDNGMRYLPGVGEFYTPPFEAGTKPSLKQQFETFLKAARGELLRQAGHRIAQTPEGQAAIREEALRQARGKAGALLPLALIAGLVIYGMRR